MFGPEIVTLYKNANEKHPACTVVKSQEAAEDLRALVAMDIKYMIGCDQVWNHMSRELPQVRARQEPQLLPQFHCLRLRRATTAPRLPLRQWTQVTSLNGTRSMCCPYHCRHKTMMRATSGRSALRMRGSSSAGCPRKWRPHFRQRRKRSMRVSKNCFSEM